MKKVVFIALSLVVICAPIQALTLKKQVQTLTEKVNTIIRSDRLAWEKIRSINNDVRQLENTHIPAKNDNKSLLDWAIEKFQSKS